MLLPTVMFVCFLLFEECRLTGTEETVRAASKRLTQGLADFNKAISSAKTEEEKTKIVSFVIYWTQQYYVSGAFLSKRCANFPGNRL